VNRHRSRVSSALLLLAKMTQGSLMRDRQRSSVRNQSVWYDRFSSDLIQTFLCATKVVQPFCHRASFTMKRSIISARQRSMAFAMMHLFAPLLLLSDVVTSTKKEKEGERGRELRVISLGAEYSRLAANIIDFHYVQCYAKRAHCKIVSRQLTHRQLVIAKLSLLRDPRSCNSS